MNAGAIAFLTKPFDGQQLLQYVERALMIDQKTTGSGSSE
jgi:FixJ family two-component response regulator